VAVCFGLASMVLKSTVELAHIEISKLAISITMLEMHAEMVKYLFSFCVSGEFTHLKWNNLFDLPLAIVLILHVFIS
jgi:hypothetical protein